MILPCRCPAREFVDLVAFPMGQRRAIAVDRDGAPGIVLWGQHASFSGAFRMSLSMAEILGHPRLPQSLRRQATTLGALHASDPRGASVFATQQRWLLAHVGIGQCFRNAAEGTPTVYAAKFLDTVVAQRIASRNTADAFLKEMEKYGYLASAEADRDRRTRPLVLTPVTIGAIAGWVAVHLITLDALDDGQRAADFMAGHVPLTTIHPLIADGLVNSEVIRAPAPAFSLFTWLNEGGIVMDWLFAGLTNVPADCARIPSTVTSFADIGERINLSSTHLARKLRQAETMGSLGWFGPRGRSTMWVSAEFRDDYHSQQAVKLAIIDAAFHGSRAAQGS